MIPIPDDSVLLPTQKGGLLVSPSYGLFCAVMADEISAVESALANRQFELGDSLSETLHNRLKQHGFGGAPRPFKHETHMIQFQVTNACNLHCIYCAVDSGKARPNELSLDDIKRAIDEAVDIFPDIQVSFTGGEPLIVPWIFEAVDYAIDKTTKQVGLLSNLLLLKNNASLLHRVAALIRADCQVRMSISAVDREACNRLSGKNCYDDALEVIQLLKKEGVCPELDIPLSAPDTQANCEALPQFRRSLPPELKYQFCIMYSGGREKGEHVFSTHDAFENALNDICFEGGINLAGLEPSPVACRRKGCPCVNDEQLFVRSDGAIFSCFKLVGELGHLSEGLKTVVNRRRETPHFVDLEPCRSCPFRHLCAGGCLSDRLIYQKAYQKPVCGPWRKKLIAEMLFEDKTFVFDWDILHLLAEAKKRGLS